MNRTFFIILAVAFLAGCSGNMPNPPSRLQQPAGEFSFVTPDGWFRTKLAGIDFIIVSGEPDFGSKPNLFVDFVKTGSINDITRKVISRYQDSHESYKVSIRSNFTSNSGLNGIKITAGRKTGKASPLATFHYLLHDAERVIVITASCAETVKEKYEPIFDAAMRSLKSER